MAVAVRIRPLNKRELALKSAEIARATSAQVIHMDDNPDTVQDDDRDYAYDSVFGPGSRQTEVYDATAKHVLDRVMDGYNATIFACELLVSNFACMLLRLHASAAFCIKVACETMPDCSNCFTSPSDSCESDSLNEPSGATACPPHDRPPPPLQTARLAAARPSP